MHLSTTLQTGGFQGIPLRSNSAPVPGRNGDHQSQVNAINQVFSNAINRAIHNAVYRQSNTRMTQITANVLKTRGIAAIEASLAGGRTEAMVSVRGADRFVVMELAQYQHLRECELEAALAESCADIAAGRYVVESPAAHVRRVQTLVAGAAMTEPATETGRKAKRDKSSGIALLPPTRPATGASRPTVKASRKAAKPAAKAAVRPSSKRQSR